MEGGSHGQRCSTSKVRKKILLSPPNLRFLAGLLIGWSQRAMKCRDAIHKSLLPGSQSRERRAERGWSTAVPSGDSRTQCSINVWSIPLWSIRWTHISHFLGQFHFIVVCFLTGGKLPYNAILVSAIQQGQSAIIIQISPHSWASFLKRHMYPNIDCSTIYNSQDNSSLCPWYIFAPKVFPVGKINYMITLVIYQIYEHLICNGKRVPKNHFGSLKTMCPN